MFENIIIALISAVSGGGLAGLITWKATNRKAEEEAESVAIANDSAVIQQWKDIYENFKAMHDQEIDRIKIQYNAAYNELKEKESGLQTKIDNWEARVNELRAQIDSLYEEINKHRDEKSQVKAELMEARIQCEKLDRMKCERRGCLDRIPPSESMM